MRTLIGFLGFTLLAAPIGSADDGAKRVRVDRARNLAAYYERIGQQRSAESYRRLADHLDPRPALYVAPISSVILPPDEVERRNQALIKALEAADPEQRFRRMPR